MADDTNDAAPAATQPPPLTKKEAVRRALEQEGPDATPSQLQPILKDRFGFDMNLNHISTAKRKVLVEAAEKASASEAAVAAPQGGQGAKPAVTKQEAVRRAMQIAGENAELELLQKLVKDEFGLDMTVKHVSTARGKIRSQEAEAEDEPAETAAAVKEEAPVVAPAATPEPATSNGEETSAAKPRAKAKPAMTKKEAVRRALARLGMDATLTELQKVIKRLGIDMTNDHVSTTKGDIRREMAAKEEASATPTAPTPVAEALAPAPPVVAPVAEEPGFGLQDIQAAKELVGRIGAEKLKGLIDVLAK